MNFVQPIFLAAAAAVAIPIIVHLIFRWQTRRVELGTIRFLAEIIRENARRKRLKRWLLLALRAAAVALLALLFARPFLLATQTSGKDRLVVILVDQSASMSLRSDGDRAVDRAVERAQDVLRSASENTDWELAFFDDAVHPVKELDDDDDEPVTIDDLAAPERLYGATSYGAALAWARDLCVTAPHATREVYVLTDLQRSGLDWTSAEPFPEGAIVHVEDFGRGEVNNVAVVNAAVSSTLVRPGEAASFHVTLFNYGPFLFEDVPVLITLTSGTSTHRLKQSVSLPSEQAAELDIEVPSLAAGLWQGTIELDLEDDLRFDNHRHVAVLAAPQQQTLIVDGSDPAAGASETFFLEAALRLASSEETYAGSPFVPRTMNYDEEGRLPALDDVDLVVLADAPHLSAADAERLADFVREGGGLLIFSGDRTTPQSARALAEAGLLPGRIGEARRSRDLPYRWHNWNQTHPLLAPFADPQYGDLRRLAFTAYSPIVPEKNAVVLAEFAQDAPALVEKRLGGGRVLWFSSGLSRSWGDWTQNRLFLPLVHQMLGDLAGLTGGGPVRSVLLDELKQESKRPGVFQRDGHWEIVNANSRESETDRVPLDEFARRFEFQMEQVDETTAVVTSAAGMDTGRLDLRADEIWHWIVLIVVVVLFLEVFLANRTTA